MIRLASRPSKLWAQILQWQNWTVHLEQFKHVEQLLQDQLCCSQSSLAAVVNQTMAMYRNACCSLHCFLKNTGMRGIFSKAGKLQHKGPSYCDLAPPACMQADLELSICRRHRRAGCRACRGKLLPVRAHSSPGSPALPVCGAAPNTRRHGYQSSPGSCFGSIPGSEAEHQVQDQTAHMRLAILWSICIYRHAGKQHPSHA